MILKHSDLAHETPEAIAKAISTLKADGRWYGGSKNYFSKPGRAIKNWFEGEEGTDVDTAVVAVMRRISGADKNDDAPIQPHDDGSEEEYDDPYGKGNERGKPTVIIGPGVTIRGNVNIRGDVEMRGKVKMDGVNGTLEVTHFDAE
jgi:hypothetical protein